MHNIFIARTFDTLMNMKIYCYDLVGVDSKTSVLYLLFNSALFSLCFYFLLKNHKSFGTRLRFN
jgi:hypothetical protein